MQPEITDPFSLKVRELLKEVMLDLSAIKTIDQVAASISDAIRGISEQRVGHESVPGFIRDIGAPQAKLSFLFVPPTAVTVSGSHSIECVTKPHINIDLLVRMPKDCFYEKDYLNHLYHAKRCLYLYVIAEHFKQSPLVRKVQWSTFGNEARKPVLHIFPDLKSVELSKFFIRVIPTASSSLFPISKLSLARNNIRAATQGGVTLPTPKYNNSILEDMFLEESAELVKKTFTGNNNFVEALALLKVWARQRSTIHTHDCLNGFLLSVIMSYLGSGVGEYKINGDMNAWQIFCVMMNFLANSKSFGRGLLSRAPRNLSDDEMNCYRQSFDAVLFDPSCHANLFCRMTRSAYSELRDETARAHRRTLNGKDGGFEELFMTKVDFPTKFDYFSTINLRGKRKLLKKDFGLDVECWRLFQGKIQTCLELALTDRVSLVRVIWENTPSDWDVKDGFTKFFHEPLLVGMLVSSCEKSFRVVDICPDDDKEKISDFRKFWGEKSELRRFKDGRITESVVWNCELWERHLIVKRITEYALLKHFLILADHAVLVADQLDFCLLHGSRDPTSISSGLIKAFEALSKRLRLLDGIPLKISSVQPLDPSFRSTSVFPPEPNPVAHEKFLNLKSSVKLVPSCIQPLEVMIQLEGSGNWPLDVVAIEKTKSAFVLKIAQSLQERFGMECTATESEVDVLMLGYAFRLRILHEKALGLLTNPVENNKIRGLSLSDKELFLRSQHASMINGLNGQHPMYGSVVRLAKRWITSHLFSDLLAAEAIELLVAHIFLNPFPFNPPCSRISGFLRFLRLLATHDWTFSPLFVDINGSFSLKDEQEINQCFSLTRRSYEDSPESIEPAMFLATSYDKSSEAWTKASPKMEVLKRIMAYAKSSANLMSNLILQGANGLHTWECLFKTPLNNYDAVVLLHPHKLSYPWRLLFKSETKGKLVLQGSACKDFQPYLQLDNDQEQLMDVRNSLLVGFDPVACFVEDLQVHFQDTFRVWYDSLGGDAVGLTWTNQSLKKRSREIEDLREVVDILKDVGEVGKGLVRSVYLTKAPRLRS